MIAISLFSKYFKMHDCSLIIIALASRTLGMVVAGLASNRFWFYFSSVIELFSLVTVVGMRSFATKIVDPNEAGKIYFFLLSDFCPIGNRIYIF
jgi:hypothetical protein